MPTFQKLSQEEVKKLKKRKTPTLDLSQYLSFLDALKTGEWGSVSLQENESQRAIKRRLTLAAKRQSKTIKYRKTQDNRIVFEVK